ncbi:MAG: hypothetical protein QNJ90_03865 [Planctomycetota bacterium]|nr:hypothetical protein [Planctomycetota bacterium]
MSDARTDPVAQQVGWEALEPSRGSNIRTHRIVKSTGRWHLKPTPGVYAIVGIAWFFAALGLIVGFLTFGRLPWWGTAVAIGAGTFFMFTGLLVYRRVEQPFFDLGQRRFRAHAKDDGIPFKQIHAVQLAPYMVDLGNEKDRYPCCELNLVLGDASRVRVLSHGGLDALRLDAGEIAGLLKVPLWDGTTRA